MSPAERLSAMRAAAVAQVEQELVHELQVSAPQEQQTEAPERHLHIVRQVRRRRRGKRLVVAAAVGALVAVPMGLVALHALMAEEQFRIDRLGQEASALQAQYQKLRLNVAQLEAPARIVSLAEGKLHMQQPGAVTYLPAPAAAGGDPAAPGAASGGAPQGPASWPAVKPLLGSSAGP